MRCDALLQSPKRGRHWHALYIMSAATDMTNATIATGLVELEEESSLSASKPLESTKSIDSILIGLSVGSSPATLTGELAGSSIAPTDGALEGAGETEVGPTVGLDVGTSVGAIDGSSVGESATRRA